MAQNEQRQLVAVSAGRWMEVGAISGLIGSILLAIIAVALHTSLTDAQFAVVNPVGAVAVILMAFALPVLYLSERHWFGFFARAGYGSMAAGWIITALMLTLFAFGSELAGLAFPVGWLLAMIGAFVFGIAMVQSDDVKVPRVGAWLLTAALPVGLPLSIVYTWYAFGWIDGFWNGPLVLYALAWLVFSYHLLGSQKGSSVAEVVES